MQTKENKMGVMPIDKLLISMSLPMMISMLVQALYNIVDSIFVSRINEYALRAVSLAFPIQSLMIAVAVGTAVGINAFLSKTLGEKDFEKLISLPETVFSCDCKLRGFCGDRSAGESPLFCQPDGSLRSTRVRSDVSDDLLCGGNGYFSPDDL